MSNTAGFPFLSLILFAPLVGALAVLIVVLAVRLLVLAAVLIVLYYIYAANER